MNVMEEIDESFVTSGIDRYMKLLYDKKRVNLDEASKILEIPSKRLEYWSYILETNGFVKINYTLTDIYIEWLGSG